MSGSSSDDADPSGGEEGDHTNPSFITPETVHGDVSSGQVAALWTVRSGGTAEEGEEKGPAAAIEDLPEVSAVPSTLTALQQRVLDRLVGSFDTTDCSIVVTNPHVKGAPCPCRAGSAASACRLARWSQKVFTLHDQYG